MMFRGRIGPRLDATQSVGIAPGFAMMTATAPVGLDARARDGAPSAPIEALLLGGIEAFSVVVLARLP
jgi:hypothetical protein